MFLEFFQANSHLAQDCAEQWWADLAAAVKGNGRLGLAIGFASMADPDNIHNPSPVIDTIYNPGVPNAHAPQILLTTQLAGSRRARRLGETLNPANIRGTIRESSSSSSRRAERAKVT